MKELTRGSIVGHLLTMTAPVLLFMAFQAAYVMVDLYFAAQLGDVVVAGVGTASVVSFVISSFTQVLGVGTAALTAHAVGRKDSEDGTLLLNQSLALSLVFAAVVMLVGYTLAGRCMGRIAADAATTEAAVSYLHWSLPGLALQFPLASVSGALRGGGIVRPTMAVYIVTIVINIVLAPVLIVGWGSGVAFGAAGGGLAISISVTVGALLLWIYIRRMRDGVIIDRRYLEPRLIHWRRILKIGLPAGAEIACTFIHTAAVYWAIREFGPHAQAAFGVSSRILQALMMPAAAISQVSGPIVGQSFGAADLARVREVHRATLILSVAPMIGAGLLLYWAGGGLLRPFSHDPTVVAIGEVCLRISAATLLARGVVYACSGIMQGLGNTLFPLLSAATALAIFSIAVVWHTGESSFSLESVWYLSTTTFALQALLSILLLRLELDRLSAHLSKKAEAGGSLCT
jgi:putative MATE family efflux protein